MQSFQRLLNIILPVEEETAEVIVGRTTVNGLATVSNDSLHAESGEVQQWSWGFLESTLGDLPSTSMVVHIC